MSSRRAIQRLEIHVPAASPARVGASYQSCPLRVRGPLFDQLAVPIKTIGKTLVNLSGPTSVLKRKQLSVVHDASVLAYPESFAPMFRWAYRVMYWAAVHFIEIPVTVSAFSRSEIVKHYGGRARRFAVVSCGSEHAERIRAVPPSVEVPEPYVVCIGSLTRRKNLRPCFTRPPAMASMSPSSARQARARSSVETVPPAPSATSQSTISGRLADAETAFVIDRASALVFSMRGSRSSGRGGAAEGCPVIAAETSSLPEVLTSPLCSSRWTCR